jgi:hypothetical protein
MGFPKKCNTIKPKLTTLYCDVFGVLETPFGLLLWFIYDYTNRHYNYFYNVRSSLPCWFFILVGPLIAGFLVAALTLRLRSVPLICRWVSDLLWSMLWSTSVFILLCFYFLPPWNRVLAPRIEDTLSKGYLWSSTQRWLMLLRNPTILSLSVVARRRYLSRCLGIPSRWLAMLTSLLVMYRVFWKPLRSKHHIRHNTLNDSECRNIYHY